MKYKLLAIDLDGTLLDKQEKVSKYNLEKLKQVKDLGIIIAIVTGRRYFSMLKVAQQLEIDAPYACFNGGLIVDSKRSKLIKSITLEKNYADRLFDNIANLGVPVFAYRGGLGKPNVYYKNESLHPRIQMYLQGEKDELVKVNDATDISFSPMCIKTFGFQEEVDKAYNFVIDSVPNEVQVLKTVGVNGTHYLEFYPKKANKAFALEYLSKLYNIPQSDIIAIGDNLNDKEMIEWAGLGIAVGNAHPDIVAIADYVTEKAEDSGVGKAIAEIFNIR